MHPVTLEWCLCWEEECSRNTLGLSVFPECQDWHVSLWLVEHETVTKSSQDQVGTCGEVLHSVLVCVMMFSQILSSRKILTPLSPLWSKEMRLGGSLCLMYRLCFCALPFLPVTPLPPSGPPPLFPLVPSLPLFPIPFSLLH